MGQFKLESRKLHVSPKVTKMGSIIGHSIDHNGVGALRGQQHIPCKSLPKHSPPLGGGGEVRALKIHEQELTDLGFSISSVKKTTTTTTKQNGESNFF